MSWITVDQWTPNTFRDNWYNITYRQLISPESISANGTKVRFTFRAGPNVGFKISSCFVGIAAASGNPTDFASAPTRVTFGGNNGFDLAGDGTITSDEIDFAYDSANGRSLIISWYVPNDGTRKGSLAARTLRIGSSLHYTVGNYADAMPGDMGGSLFFFDSFSAGSVVRTQMLTANANLISSNFEFDYNIAKDTGLSEVSKFSVYALTRLSDLAEVSKFSMYAVTRLPDLAEVSKLSLYVIADRSIHVDFVFDYYIGDVPPISADYSFDYVLGTVEADYAFDYKIEGLLAKDFTFDYVIGSQTIGKDFNFDYGITDEVTRYFDFDYRIAFEPPRPIQFDYKFDYVIERNRKPVALVPETPVIETISFVTAKAISYNGTEQRASLRAVPVSSYEYRYVIEHDGRQVLYAQMMENIRGEFFVPIFAYATRILQPMAAGNVTIYCDNARTDIRVGDTVFVISSNEESFGTAICDGVGNGYITVRDGVPVDLLNTAWVMPARAAQIADGSQISMVSMSGESVITYDCLDRRPLVRPGAPAGLVPTFDGLPLLDVRPLANDEVQEAFSANVVRIAVPDVPPARFPTWLMPRNEGERKFLVRRPEDMDFWREFIEKTNGQRSSFFFPTFRPDLTPLSVGIGASSIIVMGGQALAWYNFDAYRRVRIETLGGTYIRKITSATKIGDNTEITLDTELSDTNVTRISYVNRVRLASDELQIEHDETFSTVSFTIRTVNE